MDRQPFFIGVDVGTGSARAGIFGQRGNMMATASFPITTTRPRPDFVEQSSGNIWTACVQAVKEAVRQSGLKPDQIRGIGFDATCSLVVLGKDESPVTVSPTGEEEQNVIVWMDHRALEQAARINATGHPVLRYVGGTISPEMQAPKLLWLKENLPDTWRSAAAFYDLPDFLVHRATGADVRSLCSTVCKWTYLGHETSGVSDSVGRWDDTFWRAIGLDELVDESYLRIGRTVRPMGEAVGHGLSAKSAVDFGLNPGTPVGVSIIDAHAGGLGMLGASAGRSGPTGELMESRLALIGGTSSCHMAVSRQPFYIDGIWGPYYSAMISGLWLTEGGQSATGALVDHIVFSHARSAELKTAAEKNGRTVYDLLNQRLDEMGKTSDFPAALTARTHVLPYFLGNRSPRANPELRGMISGLKLSDSTDDLALLYLAVIQSIAYGTRHIIQEMNAAGYQIDTIFACGGGTRNRVFLREHADITGCRIILPAEPEAVLLGASILGAVASGEYGSLLEAMSHMNSVSETIEPAADEISAYHQSKYEIFLKMYKDQTAYDRIMGI